MISSSLKRKPNERTNHGNNFEEEPPKKRRQPSANHPYQPHGPSSMWLQTHSADTVSHFKGHQASRESCCVNVHVCFKSGVRISLFSQTIVYAMHHNNKEQQWPFMLAEAKEWHKYAEAPYFVLYKEHQLYRNGDHLCGMAWGNTLWYV